MQVPQKHKDQTPPVWQKVPPPRAGAKGQTKANDQVSRCRSQDWHSSKGIRQKNDPVFQSRKVQLDQTLGIVSIPRVDQTERMVTCQISTVAAWFWPRMRGSVPFAWWGELNGLVAWQYFVLCLAVAGAALCVCWPSLGLNTCHIAWLPRCFASLLRMPWHLLMEGSAM